MTKFQVGSGAQRLQNVKDNAVNSSALYIWYSYLERLYYLLKERDPEFLQIFKIQADFNERVERNQHNLA